MMKAKMIVILCFLGGAAGADTLVAAHTIKAQTVLSKADMEIVASETPGALTRPEDAVGLEILRTIYVGKPVMSENLALPAIIERNQLIKVVFRNGGLTIFAEGRALERGSVGTIIRAMNLASHNVISGTIDPDGTLRVELSN